MRVHYTFQEIKQMESQLTFERLRFQRVRDMYQRQLADAEAQVLRLKTCSNCIWNPIQSAVRPEIFPTCADCRNKSNWHERGVE